MSRPARGKGQGVQLAAQVIVRRSAFIYCTVRFYKSLLLSCDLVKSKQQEELERPMQVVVS